jgi:hypothetical protein
MGANIDFVSVGRSTHIFKGEKMFFGKFREDTCATCLKKDGAVIEGKCYKIIGLERLPTKLGSSIIKTDEEIGLLTDSP